MLPLPLISTPAGLQGRQSFAEPGDRGTQPFRHGLETVVQPPADRLHVAHFHRPTDVVSGKRLHPAPSGSGKPRPSTARRVGSEDQVQRPAQPQRASDLAAPGTPGCWRRQEETHVAAQFSAEAGQRLVRQTQPPQDVQPGQGCGGIARPAGQSRRQRDPLPQADGRASPRTAVPGLPRSSSAARQIRLLRPGCEIGPIAAADARHPWSRP